MLLNQFHQNQAEGRQYRTIEQTLNKPYIPAIQLQPFGWEAIQLMTGQIIKQRPKDTLYYLIQKLKR